MLTEVTTKAYKAYITTIVLIHCQSLWFKQYLNYQAFWRSLNHFGNKCESRPT